MIETLAVSAIAALAPYLGKAAEGFAEKFGEKLADKVSSLYRSIRKAFAGDSYAEQTLTRVEANPTAEAGQAMLKQILIEKMEASPSFKDEIATLINEAKAVDVNNVIASGERSVAIGRYNSGVIVTGNVNSPDK
jgi:hypothetical protein